MYIKKIYRVKIYEKSKQKEDFGIYWVIYLNHLATYKKWQIYQKIGIYWVICIYVYIYIYILNLLFSIKEMTKVKISK